MQANLFNFPKKILYLIAVLLMVLGFGIRLVDLKDAPFDFNPVRQLRGALNARYLYYQMLPDATNDELEKVEFFKDQLENLEPMLFESLMAVTYKLTGGENIWIARIYSSIFWLIGGWFLFQLARKISTGASALVALGLYLFLPFTIYASRSFQPDPMTTMWIILSVYAAYSWVEEKNWKWAVRLGIFGSLAVLTKGNAVFYIGLMMLALVFKEYGIKAALRDKKIWVVAGLMIAPVIIYYLFILGDDFIGFMGRATAANINEIFTPRFYIQWMTRLKDIVNIAIIFFALMGVILSKPRIKTILIGLWSGYIVFGLVFHYHFRTHDYYHIVLPFLVALSLLPVLDLIFEKISKEKVVWQLALIGVLLVAMSFGMFRAAYNFIEDDYQVEVDLWEKIGEEIPDDGLTVSIMPHYGHQLMYYGWQKTHILFPDRFDSFDASEYSYLLVINMNQFDGDPEFKQRIIENYPLLVNGGYYFIFDLRNSLIQ